MADERWEEQFKQFLRKTGDDFRRAGEDVRAEAQRLFDAAVDPQKQQKVRDRLKVLTGWARKTAEDVAGMVEKAASQLRRAAASESARSCARISHWGIALDRLSDLADPILAPGDHHRRSRA